MAVLPRMAESTYKGPSGPAKMIPNVLPGSALPPHRPPPHTQCWPASVPGRPQLWAAAMAFLHFLLLLASQLSRSMSTSGKNANTLLLASSVLLLPFFLTILCPMASAFFSLLLAVSCCPHSRKCIPWPFQQWQLPWLPKACGPSATLP